MFCANDISTTLSKLLTITTLWANSADDKLMIYFSENKV